MNGCMDGSKDGRMDGWMEGRMGGWMDGWKDGERTVLVCSECHNKVPQTGWFKQQKFIFSQF